MDDGRWTIGAGHVAKDEGRHNYTRLVFIIIATAYNKVTG
jgi:hypothetical protein